jgi:PAS domain S-box-containing protein
VPIQVGGETVALLNVESTETDAFGETEIALFELIAVQIAKCIDVFASLEGSELKIRELADRARRGREFEQLFELLADRMDHVVVMLDAEGSVRYVSRAWQQHLGRDPTEAISKPLSTFTPRQSIPALPAAVAQIKGGSPIAGFAQEFLHAHDHVIPFECLVVPHPSPPDGSDRVVLFLQPSANGPSGRTAHRP